MRLQVESEVVVFALGLTRQRLPTARAADSKRYAHSAGPDPKYVFFQKQAFLVGFRLYGHVHRLS